VHSNILINFKNLSWLTERAILAAKNDDVDGINSKILSMLPGEPIVYESIDTNVEEDDAVNFPVEVLNTLNPPRMPPHRLYLKVGTPIILLRNMDPPKLCNDTRLCVKRLLRNTIEAIILTGKCAGETVLIPRIPLIASNLEFPFKRL
jgi:ATP-dependent DNA helicase PIF1